MSEMLKRVGGAILLAETEWNAKSGVSKERVMALAAIEAMREPTTWMLNEAVQISQDQGGNVAGYEYWQRMIDAALDQKS